LGCFSSDSLQAFIAIIFASIALSGMGRTNNSEGKGQAIAGLVLGIVDVLGWVLVILIAANA